MAISRSVRNSQDPSVPEAPMMKSPRTPGVFLPVATGGKQVEGFSWLEADRFAQKGACATSFLKVPSPCVYLMLLEPDVACTLSIVSFTAHAFLVQVVLIALSWVLQCIC